MNTRTLKSFFLVLTIVVVSVSASFAVAGDDKPLFSLTPYVGGGFWSDDVGLDNSFVFGGRAALHLTRTLAIEGTYGISSAKRAVDDVDIDVAHYGADLVWNLKPSSGLSPYLTAGWAQLDYSSDAFTGTQVLNGVEVGIGVKARLGGNDANYRALRLEVRDVISNLTPSFPNDDKATHNFIATVGLQFAFGRSSKDTDGDGIRDRDDLCADTPVGARINADGCPLDGDKDGVFDGLDKCDNTPKGAMVDASGCPIDSDGDGVFNGLDKCASTPAGAVVDASGCGIDSDGDGVFDGLDKCPDTASNLQVDASGCAIAITETEVQLLDTGSITTSKILFASSSSEIDLANSPIVAEIGETLSRWPTLKMKIVGHTDDTGSASFNQKLSEERAQSVMKFFTTKYPNINAANYSAEGQGETNPIANNGTVEGRRANRRVEFVVLNPNELKREIEHRKMLEK